MEFWGVEVKVKQVVKVDKTELFGACIHLSQVALGEAKKDTASEPVVLYLKVGEQKLVLGTLTRDDIPQLSLDLVLDSEFELSHSSKNASVYFIGYRVEDAGGPLDGYDFSDSEDDELALMDQENGKPETKAEVAKVTESKKPMIAASAKQVKIADPKKDEEDESDDESDDELDDESDDEDEMDADSDSDEESDSDESEDEETPAKKVDQGKKRPNESATKSPVSTKKAKSATPEKTDGKKNVHTATPHPMKKGGKTPNSSAKNHTPNSAAKNHTPNSAAKNHTPYSAGKNKSPTNKAFTPKSGQQQNKKGKHGGR